MSKKKTTPKPTESELEILAVLWEHGPSSVRFVNDELNKKKRVGYTTTLKFLQIMHEKGLVTRESEGRTHIYTPAMGKENVRTQLLDKLLDTAFGGSASKLVMQALGNYQSSTEELDEIKELIKKLEGGEK
jgi:predicted transcriptional regulator